ncbi:MAG: putative metallopeptidase [Patescibacteria group bacterium]
MKRSRKVLKFTKSPSVKKRLIYLIKKLELNWIVPSRIFVYSSVGSKTRAYARIWGLSKLWQNTLNVKPSYIVEVISQHYDKLSDHEKDRVLMHELTHIPKNFSGALVPHTHRRKGSFRDILRKLYASYNSSRR